MSVDPCSPILEPFTVDVPNWLLLRPSWIPVWGAAVNTVYLLSQYAFDHCVDGELNDTSTDKNNLMTDILEYGAVMAQFFPFDRGVYPLYSGALIVEP